MRPILNGLSSRWVITAFGVAAAGSMVWLFGPFLTALEGWLPRVLAMAVMSFVWIGVNAGIDHVRRRADARLSAGITQGGASPSNAAPGAASGADDVAEQRERLGRAMKLLRAARGTRGYLYEQPWYVIIGPPGSGKTTALANAGLRFPLATELEAGEIRGVGGTRYCDWSFTDEAVLIDTAGRYTTQDSSAAVDREGWEGFLDLLRRTRPRQPLNGVIVAISATEIALAPEDERRAHARTIRARVKELYAKLGARIPVYVVFTKLDLIQGFTDFFDDLDRERRAQVWGMTFALETDHAGPGGGFPSEFEALTAQLSARVVDRLQAERSPERRAAIADFPTQFASLEAPLAAFIDEAFSGTRLDPAPFLRGVYFASGTQEGNPIDRLTGTLARNFGIDQRRAEALRPARGRGYFLETLLKRVVFGEATLLVRNPRAARRRRVLRGAAWTAAGLAVMGGIGMLAFTAHSLSNRQARFEAALGEYQRAVDKEKLDPVPAGATDLPKAVLLLNQSAELETTATQGTRGVWDFGLSQREALSDAAKAVHRNALERILRPRLVSVLEARLRAAGDNLDYLFRTTRVYQILRGAGPRDPAMVRAWMQSEWERTYYGDSLRGFRTDLSRHLDALLARPLEPFDADQLLLQRSQSKLSNISVGARAYALLRSMPATRTPRDFVPADAIGTALASQHFVRTSNQKLTDPIPGLFTLEGFQTAVGPNMAKAIDQAVGESWVVEATKVDATDVVGRQKVEQDLLALYTRDYMEKWDNLLQTVEVSPPSDAASAVSSFEMLTTPEGPIKRFLVKIVPNLTLSQPAAGTEAQASPAPDPAIKGLDAHYRKLREFVVLGDIDRYLSSVNQLQKQMSQTVAASTSGGAPAQNPGMNSAKTLERTVSTAPAPVSRWLTALVQSGSGLIDTTVRQQAAAAYSGPNGALPLCQQIVRRFPFNQAAREDATLEGFADLFAPNGRFDTFFAQFVQRFVDTTDRTWKPREPANPQSPAGSAGIAQFQQARIIRDTFFSAGNQPRLDLALRPLSIDLGATQVAFDLGGNLRSWAQSATNTETFAWPGPTRMMDVRVSFTPPGAGPELLQLGPWALFRLLKLAKPERTGDGRDFMFTFRQGEREARFAVQSGNTAYSPFDFGLLAAFRCPALLP